MVSLNSNFPGYVAPKNCPPSSEFRSNNAPLRRVVRALEPHLPRGASSHGDALPAQTVVHKATTHHAVFAILGSRYGPEFVFMACLDSPDKTPLSV